jgi:hypothetical protein
MPGARIEIVGNAKTGTTGVFNSIRVPLRARDPRTLLLFEPRSSSLYRLGRHPVPFPVLVKAMANKNEMKVAYDAFTHHILIVRDPRDTLVSHLLYLPLQPYGIREAGPERLEELLRALEAKEAAPESRSFRSLFELAIALMHGDKEWTWEKYLGRFDVLERLADTDDWFVLRYEDFTDNRLEPLSAYVDLELAPVVPERVEDMNGHVVRSASYGDWRHWFTPDDVEFFRPLFKSYMGTFGYDDDWAPAAAPTIDPATASGYVRSRRPIVAAKMERRFASTGDWTVASVTDAAGAEAIRKIAEDSGAAVYGSRYAQLLLEGRVVPRDPALAFEYAYKAALIGNLGAMELVAEMFRTGLGTDADLDRAAAWEREAAKLRAPGPAPGPAPARARKRMARNLRRLLER